jgi:hypothetical protein
MSVNSVWGVGEEEQGGVMEVEPSLSPSNLESCKPDVEMDHPSTATTTITAPVAKLELNGHHGPPQLLPQTRVAKRPHTTTSLPALIAVPLTVEMCLGSRSVVKIFLRA